MNILEKLKEYGYTTVPNDFYDRVNDWDSWYKGKVKNFHNFTVFNGQKKVNCNRYSLGMGNKVALDWANLLMNERVEITLEGKKEQEFVDEVFTKNNFRVKANEMQEMKAALGTAAYVVRVTGQEIDAFGDAVTGTGALTIDYVTIKNIFPLSWMNGFVRECAFGGEYFVGDKKYYYLQIHKLTHGLYDIENHLFEVNNENLTEIGLSEVERFKNIPPIVHTNSSNRQFVIDRLNIANNIDVTLPVGIPAFANAIDQLKGVDIAYDSYVNEFVLGKNRIFIKPGAMKTSEDEPAFDPNDVVYYVLPEDSSDTPMIQPTTMQIRAQEHSAGLQEQLNLLSAKCGFGERHYKFDNGNVSTATQIVSENSTLFRTIKKHEIILNDVLVELCRIILRIGNSALNLGLNEEVEISIDFDDSIIEDKAVEFTRDMQMLSAGILNDWEFRMKWRNEDEKTARAALPKMEDMTDEKQEETE